MSIDFDVSDAGIALITINRPERLNAMDAEHYQALSAAWRSVRDDAGDPRRRSSPARARRRSAPAPTSRAS